MVAPARDGEGILAKAREGRQTAGALKLAGRREVVCEGDGVNGVATLEHRPHGGEDDAVCVEEEVFFREFDKGVLEHLRREEHCGENGTLRSDV